MKKSVYIIGGGPSLKDFDFYKLKDKDIIAVNNAFLNVPWAKYFITMDYTFQNKTHKLKFRNFLGTKIFIANFDNDYLAEKDGKIVDTRFNLLYKLKPFDMIIKSRKSDGIGYSFKDFRNGTNSGFSAIQLAILLGYEEIYLLGFDLTGTDRTHYHDYYNRNPEKYQPTLDIYYSYFHRAILKLKYDYPQIQIYSCSSISKLNDFLEQKEL